MQTPPGPAAAPPPDPERGAPLGGEPADAPQRASATRCRCGHDVDHFMVSAQGEYGFWGLVTLYIGITTRPHRVAFRCRRCTEVIARTREDAVLDAVRDGRR